jgi:hypothetical protein
MAGASAPGEMTLPDRRIRLVDVADLSLLAPAARRSLAPRVIATMPPGRGRITLSREALTGLIRRSVPGLALSPRLDEGMLIFRVALAEPASAGCSELARPVAAGKAISSEDMLPVPCRAEAVPELRFDRRDGIVRAGGDLAAGAYLGRISAGAAPAADKGDKLTLVSSAGPVRIAREVVAMQPGRAGARLFVRDSEGHVTSAPLAGAGR